MKIKHNVSYVFSCSRHDRHCDSCGPFDDMQEQQPFLLTDCEYTLIIIPLENKPDFLSQCFMSERIES